MSLSDRFRKSIQTEIDRLKESIKKRSDQISEIQAKIYPLQASVDMLEDALTADSAARAELGAEDAEDTGEPSAEDTAAE